MMEIVTNFCFGLLGFSMLAAVIRIVRGPTLADRILGLDTITILAIGIAGVFAVRSGHPLYADIGITLALVGFLSTTAFARYLLKVGAK